MKRAQSRTRPGAPAIGQTRPILVTGGAGFIGCNLADRLARDGEDVLVLDTLARPGVEDNLRWLKQQHASRISIARADVRDIAAISSAVADTQGVFHFAAQVAVTTSLATPPDDFDINARGTLNLLEAVRTGARPRPLVFASTNKVYGELADIALRQSTDAYEPEDRALRVRGIGEDRPLCFHTPYGCSKGAADQYVLDYAHTFGVAAAVMRMSCVYGPRQFGTEDQGWVAHFLISALERRPIVIYGDGRQVRDVLYVGDAVEAYVKAYRSIDAVRGRAFNLGGGPANAVSLLHVLAEIKALLGRKVDVLFSDWRPGDQRYYVSDTRRIAAALDLPEPCGWKAGLRKLASWLEQHRASQRRREGVFIEAAQ